MDNTNFQTVVQSMKQSKIELEVNELFKSHLSGYEALIEKAESPILIMVMGEFSTGKSSFINALVGQKITEVDALPTTAVITKLVYGETDQVVLYYKNGFSKNVGIEEFAQWTTVNQDADKNSFLDDILYVQRALPVEILKFVNIIDSPGLNDINKKHVVVTENFIKNADTVIWVFSAIKACTNTELKAMDGLTPRLKPIAVVNKMDQLDEDEDDPEEFLENIRQQLGDRVQTVVGISAKFALEGKLQNNELKKEIGNLAALEEAFKKFVLPYRNAYKFNSYLDELGIYLDAVMYELSEKQNGLESLLQTDYAQGMALKKNLFELNVSLNRFIQKIKASCEDLANEGNPQALFLLGVLYENGLGVLSNKEVAEQYYENAAFKNHLQAITNLIMAGKRKNNLDQERYWAQKAAELGGADEAYYYANLLDGQKDVEGAFPYYEKAAALGNSNSQFKVGYGYLKGAGTPRNLVKAAMWFERCADEFPMAEYYLSVLYDKGIGVDHDPQKAFYWCQKAAEDGLVNAYYRLGELYALGKYTEKDFESAVYWWRSAANKGNSTAQYNLAKLYANGIGVKQNIEEAISYYRKAAHQNHPDALFELG